MFKRLPVSTGCLESLKVLLKDEDNLVRIKTTEVLHIMATHNIGRWATTNENQGPS